MQTFTLEDLAKETKWISESRRTRGGMKKNEMAVGFSNSKAGSPINRIIIKIGCDIIKLTKWKVNDKIILLHHPDDMLGCMLIRSDRNNGAKLNFQHMSTEILRLQFQWSRPFIPQRKAPEITPFMHVKSSNSLVFRAE